MGVINSAIFPVEQGSGVFHSSIEMRHTARHQQPNFAASSAASVDPFEIVAADQRSENACSKPTSAFAREPMNEARITELLDQEGIRDCLYWYCRGIDRADEATLRSSYWPDPMTITVLILAPPWT